MSMYYAVLVATPEPPPRHRRHSRAIVLGTLLAVLLGTLALGPQAAAPDVHPRAGQAGK